MIEIERKFRLNEGDEQRLVSGVQFDRETVQRDAYFDVPDLVLTRKDWWLRQRNGRWELKVALHPVGPGTRTAVSQYRELETEPEIREAIGVVGSEDLAFDLVRAGFAEFAAIETTRRTFRDGAFRIDLDLASFGYAVAEIELMVPEGEDRDAASARVDAYAREKGLSMEHVHGKIIEYLRRHRPEHFQSLIDAGVVWPPGRE